MLCLLRCFETQESDIMKNLLFTAKFKEDVSNPMEKTKIFSLFVSLCLIIFYSVWMFLQIGDLAPAHDEAITMLNMVNNVETSWPIFGPFNDFYGPFDKELAKHSDIGLMLKETDIHPPFYYHLILSVSSVVGLDLVYLRMVSLAFVILSSFAIVYVCTRKSEHFLTGPLILVMFFSAAPTIYAGVNARSYGLYIFLFSVICLFFFQATKDSKNKAFYVLALAPASLLALWSHYFSAIGVFAVYFCLLAFHIRTRSEIGAFLGSCAVLVLGALPLLPWLSVHFGARDNQFSGFLGIKREFLSYLSLMAEQFSFFNTSNLSWMLTLIFVAGGLSVAVIFFKGFSSKVTLDRTLFVFISIASLLLFALFYYTDKTLSPRDSARYFHFITPFLFLFFTPQGKRTPYALIMFSFFSVVSWNNSLDNIEPWRGMEQVQASNLSFEDDKLIVFPVVRAGREGAVFLRRPSGFAAKSSLSKTQINDILENGINEVQFSNYRIENVSVSDEVLEKWNDVLTESGFLVIEKGHWKKPFVD